eukprot:NODE_22_length_38364_cov_0.248661.p6 type:complete len:602 gc:universal NODE_22_length_38364_cov_0.248661:37987-36182(-)
MHRMFRFISVLITLLLFIINWNVDIPSSLNIKVHSSYEFHKVYVDPEKDSQIMEVKHENNIIYDDNDICIVSKTDHSRFGYKYYDVQGNIFEELTEIMTTKGEMFNLNCTHLLYLGHLELIVDPARLIDAKYKETGMRLFGGVKDGFLINIKRFKVKYGTDLTLQNLFKTVSHHAVLYGSNSVTFCGNLYAFGPPESPILAREKHPYVNRKYTSYKKVNVFDILETEMGCWDSSSDMMELENTLYLKQKSNCEKIKGSVINSLPDPNGWEPRDKYIDVASDSLDYYHKVLKKKSIPETGDSRGIAMLVYGAVFEDALINLKFIRKHMSNTPIEIFHNEELDEKQIQHLYEIKNLEVISIKPILKEYNIPILTDHNYHYKFSALLSSSFRHILFLDADSVPIHEPSWIFDDQIYKLTGLVMFPDMWKTNPKNPIYEVIGFECVDELEAETGQFFIDKYRHYHTIFLSFLMMKDQHLWYKFFFGDKDVLRWAARYLGNSVYVEQTFIKSLGFRLDDYLCGQTMIQSFSGILMFFHGNLLKHSTGLRKSHFSGYQEYRELSKIEPKFYMLNSFQCVAFNGGVWNDDLTAFEPFLQNYLKYRGIN